MMRNLKFMALIFILFTSLVVVHECRSMVETGIKLGPCILHPECTPNVACWCCLGDPKKQCWYKKDDCLRLC
ncbi:hypothetical protein ERO13_D04G020766v2 [Gossypium hirsutum]|uniref:Embryo surrounding factor 1 brassicaceae domain-containing protein n=4 Tax=Gossypium TaxID=3633 RepID=A0A5J5RR19_GOSBA|nr:hypothetical protein ES319_D04G023700v1 [Gossypium barbadense]KAG4150737.1 hypothetical protein ERO13_D04G020766v2 [Gossypium hirsutum]TYG72489.1 hypothetical protein ES288_D04G025000v1 [Gossypium darwinii]TYH75550.1 hypothetical protein ES332_D04G026600v1 [Gossypium tomentosum]TYI85855.1 hypothetical protein E1A91_D04G025200v1 [Gossypium mustelinum]